jgi:hypothetical protein
MADITNKNIRVDGVNSATNFIKQYAYLLDMNQFAEISEVGTHDIVNLPPGEALLGVKVIVVDKMTSGGAATLQFKVNGSAVNSTALGLAGLSDGFVHNLNVAGISAYGENKLQLTVGTAAYTGGKLLIIAETLPAKQFVSNV